MTHRHQQLEATLRRAVQQVLARGLSDPRADGAMFTLTELRLAPDLKNATVLVSIYPQSKEKLGMHALRHAAAHVRHQTADLVAMKQTPTLIFELDESIKKQAVIFDALAKVAAEREARAAASPPTEADAPPAPHAPAAPRRPSGNNPAEAPAT